MKTHLLGLTALTIGMFFIAVATHAVELNISGNGTGSDNSINYQTSTQTNVTQTNSGSVTNDVDASANTGGNSADNGSVQTGDSSIFVKIKNFFNSNSTDVNCCPTPTNPPAGGPTPTPTIYDPGKPPVGGPGGGGSGGSSNGGGGSSSSSSSSSNGEVLGLSATAGDGLDQIALYALGSLCLALGGVLVRQPKITKIIG